jgi:hypothetical protein
MSVTRPTFMPLPAFELVVVLDELLLLLPPQPATRKTTTPRSASDLFIPNLSLRFATMGRKP